MKCTRCESERIVENVKAVDFGNNDRRKGMVIEIPERPAATLFKGVHEAKVSASVCADCGLLMYSINKEDAERFYQVQELQPK